MAKIVGERVESDGQIYWIFFERGEFERPLLILHDVVLRDILRYEGYGLVKIPIAERAEEFLDEIKQQEVMGVLPPNKIKFTVECLESGLFKMDYTEYFDKLPPEVEGKLDSAMKATIGLMEQQTEFVESVKRKGRSVSIETKPLPVESIASALIGEIMSMAQGIYPVSKLQEIVKVVRDVFAPPVPSEIKPIEDNL